MARPVTEAMKAALEYVGGGMSINAAAAETGLTFQAIHKSLRLKKQDYEWKIVVKGPDSGTSTHWVIAPSINSAIIKSKFSTRYAIILAERGPAVTRKPPSRSGTTSPNPSGP